MLDSMGTGASLGQNPPQPTDKVGCSPIALTLGAEGGTSSTFTCTNARRDAGGGGELAAFGRAVPHVPRGCCSGCVRPMGGAGLHPYARNLTTFAW